MARLERYIDNLHGNDSWDGTSPIHPSEPPGNTIGPWKTLNKACTTDPGSGNRFVFYLANNNDPAQGIFQPYRREAGSYLLPIQYNGISAAEPMEWHLNGAWLSGGIPIVGEWEKVPGTSYVYRIYLPGLTTSTVTLWSCGADSFRAPGWLPYAWKAISSSRISIPTDGNNHSFYWDSTNRYLYICDWSGNPNVTGVYFETYNDYYLINFSSGVRYHRFIGGVFYNLGRKLFYNVYGNIGIERCYIFGDTAFYYTVDLPSGSYSYYNLITGRETTHASNSVIYVTGTGTKIYNNLIYGSNYGVRLASGAAAEVKNNIFCGQAVSAYKFDALPPAGLTTDHNAYGTLELDNYYGLCPGIIPNETEIAQFPGQAYGVLDKVFRYDGNSFQDITAAAANDDDSDFQLMGSSSHYLYFGNSKPFMGLLFKLSIAGNYSSMTWQYYAGSGSGWVNFESYNLRGVTNFNTFYGVVAWNLPPAWMPTSVNGSDLYYWVRVKAGTVNTMGVGKYIRNNGSLWENFTRDRDCYDLRPVNTKLYFLGHKWNYDGYDLSGKQVKISTGIGPYAVDRRNNNLIEIESKMSQ